MKNKLFALVALLLVATVTGVTFAQITATTTTGVGTVGPGGAFADVRTAAQCEPAAITLNWAGEDGAATAGTKTTYYTAPAWSPSVDASGQIPTSCTLTAGGGYTGPGDLYYIDSAGYQGDILVTLYLNNPQDLSKNYTYLNMLVNAYSRSVTVVEDENVGTGTAGTPTFALALNNAPVVTGTLTVTDGVETFTVASTLAGVDTLSSVEGGSGSLILADGTGTVTFATAPANGAAITADYTYSTDVTDELVGTGDAGTLIFTDTLGNTPIVSGTVSVTDGVQTYGMETSPTTSTSGLGTAEWSTDYALSGTYSVKLVGGNPQDGDDYAIVDIPLVSSSVGGTLNFADVTSFIYNYYFATAGTYGPHMCFYTHDPVDNETGEITLYSGGAGGTPAAQGWNTVTVDSTTDTLFWYGSETGSALTEGLPNMYTLAQFQADAAFSTHVIDRITIEYGWWSAGDASEPAYVDDTTIVHTGGETFTDAGDGTLTGSVGGANKGTVNYTSGALSVTFNAAPALGAAITVDYTYTTDVDDESVGTGGAGGTTNFTDTLVHNSTTNEPIVSGSVVVTNGSETLTVASTSGGVDTLSSSAGGYGTLNLSSGALDVTFNTAPDDNAAVTADYSYYAGSWTDENIDEYLTLTNGYVSFIVTTPGVFTITIDSGIFYCIGDGSSGSLSPSFYIDVRQS